MVTVIHLKSNQSLLVAYIDFQMLSDVMLVFLAPTVQQYNNTNVIQKKIRN